MTFQPQGLGLEIFKKRHAAHEDEIWPEACKRVAACVSNAEEGTARQHWYQVFKQFLEDNLFMPGGRIWYGAGRPRGQLLNCFVIPTADSREGWGKTLFDSVVISGTGGGVGINFSPTRPKGSLIRGTGGQATGAVSEMRMVNNSLEEIKAGGGRRTALMFCLSLSHPDINEFLDAKLDLDQLNNANVSVVFDEDPEEFFELVRSKKEFPLLFQGKQVGSIPADDLWRRIIQNALKGGEPGLLNGYLANRMSNIWYLERLTSTNPCGEIWMSPYDCCCLGALVLPRFVKGEDLDWSLLKQAVAVGVRFLDDVLTVNTYPLPEIQQKCSQLRRIGLGITGLHDMLLELGMKYNSAKGLELVDKLMKFIKNASYEASVELAKEKGSFPAFDCEKFLQSKFIKTLKPSIREMIREHGIRNCALNTIAPTGTISIVCGCSSGIEPLFAPAYKRKFRDGDRLAEETVVHPLFQMFVQEGRSVKHFQGAYELKLRDHFEMQRVCQAHVDNAVSKCLAAGTLIPTDKGLIPVESFSNVDGDDTFAELDASIKTATGERIIRHYRMGFGPATRIRLDNGSELVGATETHRVMTPDGWRLMSELHPGDLVVCKHVESHGPGGIEIEHEDVFKANARKITTPKKMSPELAEWLGMLASDGHTNIGTGAVSLCWKEKPEVSDRFTELTRRLFDVSPVFAVDRRTGVEGATLTSRNLVRFVTSLIGSRARDKHVPSQILQGSREEKLAFMRGLTLDGFYNPIQGLTVYGGISRDLAYQTSELARSFGLGGVRFDSRPYVNEGEHVYEVRVTGALQKLIVPIELHKRGPVVESDHLVYIDRSCLEQVIPTSHPNYSAVRALRQDKGRSYCKSRIAREFGWSGLPIARVTHVEDAGTVEMYDIEVEGSHSYVVNGILSHNTINVPQGTPWEELSELYMEFLPELKGVTVYPDGSREDQPLTPLSNEEAEQIAFDAVAQAAGNDSCKSGVCDV